jgi:TDG/mug DNA glycosylase family protein
MCGAPVVVAFSGKKQFSDLFTTTTRSASYVAQSKRKTQTNNTTSMNQINKKSTNSSTTGEIRLQSMRPATIPLGRQSVLPQGWPLPVDTSEVWVMTSTSGAAAMTKEARYAPWKALAERLAQEPWPLHRKARYS